MRYVLLLLLLTAPAAAEDSRLAIHLISGSKEYQSETSLKILQQHLESRYRVSVTASWVQDGAKNLPGVEHIPNADLLIVFARRMKLPESQMAVIRKHWESGKPIVGVRTSSHAFSNEDNPIFDRRVMGGNYQGHFGAEDVQVSTAKGAADHPVLQGVGKIVSQKMYKTGPLAKNAVLLQNGSIPSKQETHAATWTHRYQGGRMFYTSLGVPEDFQDEDFLRMIVNAVFWTTKTKAADYPK